MRTLPPMPSVSVVTPTSAKAAPIHEEANADGDDVDDGEDPDAEYLTPCKAKSIALHSAELAFDAFGTKVRALPITGDPKPLEAELEKLLEHPCFEIAKLDPKEPLEFTSALSLRQWWQTGGSDWLYAYLHVDERRYLRVPPTPRIALTLETARKDHPLKPLLCPSDDSKPCAIETAGWTRRTSEKLSFAGNRHRHSNDEVDCRKEAEAEPKASRYGTYRACVELGLERQQMLPLGRFKAPSDGWLVIVEAHSSTCHDVHAYDLVTGSTHHATECNGPPKVVSGRVSISAIREAAWMLALARESQASVRESQGFHVPEEIPIKRARGWETIGLGTIGCGCGPSLRRSWSWMREKNGTLRGQVSGIVTGRPDNDATQHAIDLLGIADAAFEAGCAPAPPPSRIAWGSPGPSQKEGETTVLDDTESETARITLTKAKSPRTCTPKP